MPSPSPSIAVPQNIPTGRMRAWVTSGSQTVQLGILPIGSYVARVLMHCTQLFNSDGTDNVSVGYSGTTNALATNTDVSSTGVKSPTLGANIGYQSASHTVNAYYTAGGSAPTTGKCLVILEFFMVPISP